MDHITIVFLIVIIAIICMIARRALTCAPDNIIVIADVNPPQTESFTNPLRAIDKARSKVKKDVKKYQ